MLLDQQNLFSDKQDLKQAAGSYLSTNCIDLGVVGTLPGPWKTSTPPNDVGRGEPLDLLVQVVETFTSGGAATVQVQLVTAATVDGSNVPQNPTVIAETPAVGVANLKAGYQFRLPSVPPGIAQRYLALRYVIGGAATTAGKVTAGLVADKQTTHV